MPNVRKTPLHFDLKKIAQEVRHFLDLYAVDPESFQLCLTHPKNCENPLYFGAGSLLTADRKSFRVHERDFTIFYEDLQHSYLHEVYKKIQEWSPYPVGRMRICELSTRKCLSFHLDTDIRYHIAVGTNPQALMFFENDTASPYHIPADGYLYRSNTLVKHTAINAHSDDYRYHLVFSAFDENNQYDKFEW